MSLSTLEMKSLMKIFIRENNLPIVIYEKNYFEEKLDLYDKKKDFDNFLINAINLCKKLNINILDLQETIFNFKNEVINKIKNNENYKKYCDLKIENNEFVKTFRKGDIYNENYIDNMYISIDLKNANFVSLSFLKTKNIQLFDETVKNYKMFLQSVNKDIGDFLYNSKVSRQFIFGNLNPKKQNVIQKTIISKIIENLKLDYDRIVSVNSDEIIIKYKDIIDFDFIKEKIKDYNQTMQTMLDYNENILSIEYFKLKKVKELDCFVKVYENKEIELKDIKNINKNLVPIFMRYLKNERIVKNDVVFFYEKRKCMFLDYPIVSYDLKTFLKEG